MLVYILFIEYVNHVVEKTVRYTLVSRVFFYFHFFFFFSRFCLFTHHVYAGSN